MTEYKQYQLPEHLKVGASPTEKTLSLTKVTTPELKENDVLLKIEYLSVDPYMRGRMMSDFKLNAAVPTLGLGKVVESTNENIKGSPFIKLNQKLEIITLDLFRCQNTTW
jgi:NADPH-dependent curcumin reductase CurA